MKYDKEILVATNNKNKVKEIQEILGDYKILTLKDINCEIEVEEDGKTFEENAIKKAVEVSKETSFNTIADDSGLCIDIFNGWPGVYTARFLGKNVTSKQRNQAILEKMKELKGEERNASVVCVISYVSDSDVITAKGIIPGKIAIEPRGENGFGFDEIFELENGKTLAELSKEEKNNLSSRKIALENLQKQLTNK